jgi:hypothetical protein
MAGHDMITMKTVKYQTKTGACVLMADGMSWQSKIAVTYYRQENFMSWMVHKPLC